MGWKCMITILCDCVCELVCGWTIKFNCPKTHQTETAWYLSFSFINWAIHISPGPRARLLWSYNSKRSSFVFREIITIFLNSPFLLYDGKDMMVATWRGIVLRWKIVLTCPIDSSTNNSDPPHFPCHSPSSNRELEMGDNPEIRRLTA